MSWAHGMTLICLALIALSVAAEVVEIRAFRRRQRRRELLRRYIKSIGGDV